MLHDPKIISIQFQRGRNPMKYLIPMLGFIILSAPVYSATLHVPGDHPTIQEAIDASSHGDTVLVDPGFYKENIDFNGKEIWVKSTGGSAVTTINGNQMGSVVTFKSGEGPGAILDGFNLRNGSGKSGYFMYYGGGIYCESSSPTIRNNEFGNNSVGDWMSGGIGGAMYCINGAPLIENNFIHNNHAYDGGGGIALYGTGIIRNNHIEDNHCGGSGGGIYCMDGPVEISNNKVMKNSSGDHSAGGGIYCSGDVLLEGNTVGENEAKGANGGDAGGILAAGSVTLINNLLYGNRAETYNPIAYGYGGGLCCYGDDPQVCTLINNTIVDNAADHAGGGVYFSGDHKMWNTVLWNNKDGWGYKDQIYVNKGNPEITFCDIEGGWTGQGNIDSDPNFEDPLTHDYHITWLSPCINMGTLNGAPAVDIDGEARPFMGSPDLGADEFTGIHALAADLFSLPHNTKTDVVNFTLSAGPGNGLRDYLILSSLSGNAPGIPLPGGDVVVPINWDIVTTYALQYIHLPNWTLFMGTLDGSGQGTAIFTPDGILTGLMGFTMSFAYALGPPPGWDFASNPINVAIEP
jgi:hypothetical protein